MKSGSYGASDGIAFHNIDTGHQYVGNGGNGSYHGDIVNTPSLCFNPCNSSEGSDHSCNVKTDQDNCLRVDQHQSVSAGIGGNGGNGNTAQGGDVKSVSYGASDGIASHSIDTGHQYVGNGGNGSFEGNIINAPQFSFSPSNSSNNAPADQHNYVQADQHQSVCAGIGGNGGDCNTAKGGCVDVTQLCDVLSHSSCYHGCEIAHA
jgi:hypothetical protein